MDIVIKIKVLGIFLKIFLAFKLCSPKYWVFIKKSLKFQNPGLRNFSSFLTSQIRHCDVHRGLRQISTGLR